MSPGPEQAAVLFERAGAHVALVTINRPAARNAVNGAVAQGMEAAVRETEADPAIRAVVLTGAGDAAFCAGADLKEVSAGGGAALWTEGGGFAGFVFAPRTKLWIAAVNGAALAGGTEIALACDLVVAAESASFGLPEVKRGLIAAAGGLYRLPRALPRAIALELIATGGRIDARRAASVRHGQPPRPGGGGGTLRSDGACGNGLRERADRRAGEPPGRPPRGGTRGRRAQAPVRGGPDARDANRGLPRRPPRFHRKAPAGLARTLMERTGAPAGPAGEEAGSRPRLPSA